MNFLQLLQEQSIGIKNSQKYKTLSKNNQIDVEIIYPVRGKIYDTNKKLLASNVKVFDVYIIPENTNVEIRL